jgi:hypothetical protein
MLHEPIMVEQKVISEILANDLELLKIEKECWTLLNTGCNKGKDPFHTFALATATEDGVDLRTVVLRKVDTEKRLIFFHSDVRAPKINQLKNTKEVSILFYDPARRIQLRIKAKPNFHIEGPEFETLWEETRLSARKYYLSEKPPGHRLSNTFDTLPPHLTGFDPKKEESENGKENFIAVSFEINQIDWLFLCSQGHKRALFTYKESGIEANWINP